jgi:hypothetical protein
MHTQNQNPAYQRFAHLLPENGRYPARYIDIFWNRRADRKVYDVEVVFIPRGPAELLVLGEDREFWNAYATYNMRWSQDLGNSCNNWLEPDGDTPESIFGHLLVAGFVNETELRRAVEEFGSIEECSWAREMLRRLR